MPSDASIVIVQELKDGWGEYRNFSSDGVAKGGGVFFVNGLDDLLDWHHHLIHDDVGVVEAQFVNCSSGFS